MIESVVRLCYNVAVTAALQPLMNKLERELEPLVDSGTNWQLTLHGGRNGHVIIEILRKDEVMLLASERSGRRFLFEGGVMPQQVTISTTARRLLRLAAQRSGPLPLPYLCPFNTPRFPGNAAPCNVLRRLPS